MNGDHGLKLCDFFHWKPDSYIDFWVTPAFLVMATSLWGGFTLSHEISFHLSYVAIPSVVCITEKRILCESQAQMCWMVRLHIRQPQPFLVRLSWVINFSAFTGQAEWASEVCKLTHLFFTVENHTWDWGWRKEVGERTSWGPPSPQPCMWHFTSAADSCVRLRRSGPYPL